MTIPNVVFQGFFGSSIPLLSAPADGSALILVVDLFNGEVTDVASANTTWQRVFGPTIYAGNNRYDVWLGTVGTAGGDTITITNNSPFQAGAVLELPSSLGVLDGTVGQSLATAGTANTTFSLAGCTPGNIVIATCGHLDTGQFGLMRNLTPKGVGLNGGWRAVTAGPPDFVGVIPLLACTVPESGTVEVRNVNAMTSLQMVELGTSDPTPPPSDATVSVYVIGRVE